MVFSWIRIALGFAFLLRLFACNSSDEPNTSPSRIEEQKHNSLYDTIHTFGILYDTIDIVKEEIKKTRSFDDIKQDLYNIVQSEEPIILNDDGTVIDKLKLDNSIYQLNNLRTDMITWKHNKSKTYYDDDWELRKDPDNGPCRN